jgi:hypothetical protein
MAGKCASRFRRANIPWSWISRGANRANPRGQLIAGRNFLRGVDAGQHINLVRLYGVDDFIGTVRDFAK